MDDEAVAEAQFLASGQLHFAVFGFVVLEVVDPKWVGCEQPVGSRVPVGGMAGVGGVIENRDAQGFSTNRAGVVDPR